MKTAVQFGAGNIGRGFMAQFFWEGGYTIVFVEKNKTLVDMLNKEKQYPLRLLDAYSGHQFQLTIDSFFALSTDRTDEIFESFAHAEAASTAVGINHLESIAPLIAGGIRCRIEKGNGPIDIYLCENTFRAKDYLRDYVKTYLNHEEQIWLDSHVGFIGTSVARMVPPHKRKDINESPLLLAVDSFHELAYEKTALFAKRLPVTGLKEVKNIQAEFERKLYTHNLGHAALGYLGFLKGYTYVHEPLSDSELSEIFEGALDETTEALLQIYPNDINKGEHEKLREDVRIRFGNPMLLDPLVRVARDPIRKLSPADRLIGSANLCTRYNIFPRHIALVCGAAYHYNFSEDEKAVDLQTKIQERGIENTLLEVSKVDPSSEFGKAVVGAYDNFSAIQRRTTYNSIND